MIDPDEYCREIEAYLCRKNDGHLVRIVGPAFDTVRGWAAAGIPFKVACRGIDRSVERHHAKGPRRRPVPIQFCEADVLDSFDEWRRAVGVHTVRAASGDDDAPAGEGEDRRRGSLAAHLERAVSRLTVLRAGGRGSRAFDAVCERIVVEIDTARADAKRLRGEARQAVIEALAAHDAALVEAARGELAAEDAAALRSEAESELAPFRARMADDVYAAALKTATDRLVRERFGLPDLSFE